MQVALEGAQAEKARAERLLAERAVPARRVEDASRAVATAEARVHAAEARLAQRDETLRSGGGAASGNAFTVRAPITGRVSESVRLRAAELGIDDLAQDPNAQKLPAFLAMLDRHGIAPSEAAFIGDDFPDMAVLRLVGLPVAVGNAVPEVKRECAVQLTRTGGAGAVREFAELLLKARDEWDLVTERYVAERSLPVTGSSR